VLEHGDVVGPTVPEPVEEDMPLVDPTTDLLETKVLLLVDVDCCAVVDPDGDMLEHGEEEERLDDPTEDTLETEVVLPVGADRDG
jgi:hypothetical protein